MCIFAYVSFLLYLCGVFQMSKPFSYSCQPFQVSSQKFTIFKILTQFSSQPFSGLVRFSQGIVWSRCGRGEVAVRSRCGHGVVTVWWCYQSDAPCIRHAPYCDVQDANEMRTVENAKRNERHTGRIRHTYGTIGHPKSLFFALKSFRLLRFRCVVDLAKLQQSISHSQATLAPLLDMA